MYESIATFYNNNDDDDDDIAPPLAKRQRQFASYQHELFTIETVKIALNCRDNKRQWIEQNVSLPFGHYKLLHDSNI